MYFRILKRDLTDKVGLNITLFVFMILASAFIVISTHLLYSSFVGSENTYEICNTSDITMIVQNSISDSKGQREEIEAFWEKVPEYDKMYLNERVIYPGTMVEYVSAERKEEPLSPTSLMFATVQTEQNIPYNSENEKLEVPSGYVALPQNLLNNTEAREGDIVRITTQMGNVYEFIISDFYKDPSAYIYDRMLFSEADYAVLFEETPVKNDVYEIFLSDVEGDYVSTLTSIGNDMLVELDDVRGEFWDNKSRFATNDGVIGLVVALALTVVGIFMVCMIFMTIHFSLKSAIKREEKEIGIMKAIGVYSFSYRTLFAVKYIAFAIVGGIIGIPIAMPMGKLLMNQFMIHIILPTQTMRMVMAIIAVVCMILIMVLFTFLSLHSMNKISVMDAIHGDNRGERFRKMPGLFLHKKKECNIPLFLALSDILGRVKRYSYLILAYVCGIFIVLLIIQIKDSICSREYYQKYLQINALDFYMEINESYYTRLYNKEGSAEAVYESLNEKLATNDIPARIDFFSTQFVTLFFKEQELLSTMQFGDFNYAMDIIYVEGGTAPMLQNEVAIAYYTAKQAGIELGDIITIEYDKYTDDHISYEKVQEEFVVTAFFDGQSWGVAPIIMSEAFEGAVSTGNALYQYKLDCPESEYQEYYDRMDALFTDDEIKFKGSKDAYDEFFAGFSSMFNLLILVVSVVVAVVLSLITILYENIFMEEETGDVAVLKSIGFQNGVIKCWHLFRMLLLVAASYIVAIIFSKTIGNYVIGNIVNHIIHVCEFEMITLFWANYVIVPVSVILLIALCMLTVLQAVNRIQIWRIRDE